MKIVLNTAKPAPKLHWPLDLEQGTVYTCGYNSTSYLRVAGGSVTLVGAYTVIPIDDVHFSKTCSPLAKIASDVTLTLTYEVL